MRIGSTFSGIGGLELGLEWAGVGRTVWQVERDPFCRQVLAKHWPNAERFEDVREVGAHNLPPVDVICGGYPCQPFSVAGKRQGENDERHLWPEFARILGELRPRFAVLENVPGHLALGFGRVLGDLADLGYDAEWQVLRACEVGAAHPRPRLFVIAYPAGVGQPGSWGREQDASDCEASGFGEADRFVDAVRRNALPFLCGRHDGVPRRLAEQHLRAIGNAVVPQVAQIVGRRLMELANA